jgi:hypothetical protein
MMEYASQFPRDRGFGGHNGCFLIVDGAGMDYVFGVRSHTGEVLPLYLMDVDIKKILEFLCGRPDCPNSGYTIQPPIPNDRRIFKFAVSTRL